VGTLTFESEVELNEYLESLGDVVTGFFECESDSRPYNF
jgi:dsRNA-specific ribonuclease